MALSPNPLQRDRVLVQAQDTGARFSVGGTNSALRLADSLRELEPTLAVTLDGIAQQAAEKQHAEARKAALMTQGQTLAEAVRQGKIKPTQNPWFMEAYAKESAAIRAQQQLSALQLDSTAWAEQNDPAAFAKKWQEEVAKVAQGFTGKDEISGFAPVEAQFTQQTLQSNLSTNQKRIVEERTQNVSALAAESLVKAASANGGLLSADQAIAVLAPSKEMFIGTGGTAQQWNDIQDRAITSAAYSSQNAGLLDLKKGIGVDGAPVLSGKFGNGPDAAPLAPTPQAPLPALASTAVPEQFRYPVQGFKITDGFGKKRANGEVHNGIDLAVPMGTPVTSPGAGRVVEVAQDGRSGKFVKVDYGNGVVSSFAHLSAQNVKVGDRVAPGAVLGAAGSTGHSTGPHTHWVVRVNGEAVNPLSVKFPQGAVGEAAQAQAQPLAPEAVPAQSPQAPSPEVARGPSLYDIAGVADSTEQDRYRITSAQEAALTRGLQQRKAAIATRAEQAKDYLYQTHGTGILLGDYKAPQLVQELASQGFSGPEIEETLKDLSEATGATASLASNRMRINSSDPTQAKSVMDLAVEGERNGWSPDYEKRVGEAVLRGDISGDDGQSMVSKALSRTHSLQAEKRAEDSAARAAANANPGVINNYTKLRKKAGDLTSLAGSIYTKVRGRPPSPQERQKVKGLVTDAVGAWLTDHPDDYEGAYAAGRQVVADYGNRVAGHQPTTAKPSGSTSSNPRGK